MDCLIISLRDEFMSETNAREYLYDGCIIHIGGRLLKFKTCDKWGGSKMVNLCRTFPHIRQLPPHFSNIQKFILWFPHFTHNHFGNIIRPRTPFDDKAPGYEAFVLPQFLNHRRRTNWRGSYIYIFNVLKALRFQYQYPIPFIRFNLR